MEFIARVEDLKKWFKGYKVGTIELYIEGAVNEGNVTKLFLSFEGKGGYKVILKPVEDLQLPNYLSSVGLGPCT